MITQFQQLEQSLSGLSPRPAVVAAAQDSHTLEAVAQARQAGLIEPILVGDPREIQTAAQKAGLSLSGVRLEEAMGEEACARLSVELIRRGEGRLLIKGRLQTAQLLRAVVDKQSGISQGGIMSHVAVLEVPRYHKLLYLTDGGMIIAPTLDQKRAILRNAVELCRFLGYDQPKAAVLCAVEVVNPHMPETLDAQVLKEEGAQGLFGPCLVEGPISLDLATDRESAVLKDYHSPVAGDADILLVPSMVAGNLLGKSLYGLAGGKMAGVVLGASVPITVNSRGASAHEKYDSILLCCAMDAQRKGAHR